MQRKEIMVFVQHKQFFLTVKEAKQLLEKLKHLLNEKEESWQPLKIEK